LISILRNTDVTRSQFSRSLSFSQRRTDSLARVSPRASNKALFIESRRVICAPASESRLIYMLHRVICGTFIPNRGFWAFHPIFAFSAANRRPARQSNRCCRYCRHFRDSARIDL